MKINQVEELVGITKKNIRFYEDEALISPNRNPDNGYREYTLKDVRDLLKIKLLRMLNIPIEDIREMQTGVLDFDDCMEKQKKRISEDKKNLETVMILIEKMSDTENSFDSLDPDIYLSEIKHIKEGENAFMDVVKNDVGKKKIAPVIIACIVVAYLLAIIVGIVLAYRSDPIPLPVMILICTIPVLVIVGVLIVLYQRMKEIDGGEEDAAKKY